MSIPSQAQDGSRARHPNVGVPRAGDGLPRRAFTVDDITRMMEAGIFSEDERFELIEGDLVMMSPEHIAHDRIKNTLTTALVRTAPDHTFVAVEGTVQLAHDILVEPDLVVISKSVYEAAPNTFARPRPQDVLLLIEVAASSMRYDRRIKARLYARYGIREFWMIDANRCITWIHTRPEAEGWASIVEHGPNEPLTASGLPGFSIKLADLK